MLILIRHPPTALNEEGRIRGQLDPPPSPEGLLVIRKTSGQFKGVKVEKIYSDDFKRTRAMAAAIAKVTGAKVIITPGLKTWDLGDFQGRKMDKAIEDEIATYMKTPSKVIPGGESFEAFAKRFIDFIRPLYNLDANIVLVTHGRPIMTAKAWDDADANEAPMDLSGDDLSPEPKVVEPGGIAIMGKNQPFKVIKF